MLRLFRLFPHSVSTGPVDPQPKRVVAVKVCENVFEKGEGRCKEGGKEMVEGSVSFWIYVVDVGLEFTNTGRGDQDVGGYPREFTGDGVDVCHSGCGRRKGPCRSAEGRTDEGTLRNKAVEKGVDNGMFCVLGGTTPWRKVIL